MDILEKNPEEIPSKKELLILISDEHKLKAEKALEKEQAGERTKEIDNTEEELDDFQYLQNNIFGIITRALDSVINIHDALYAIINIIKMNKISLRELELDESVFDILKNGMEIVIQRWKQEKKNVLSKEQISAIKIYLDLMKEYQYQNNLFHHQAHLNLK